MSEATITSPPVSRVEPVDEEFHGDRVSDPYRWLEDGGSDEVRAGGRAQNGYTEATLSCAPGREEIKKRLTELLQTDTIGVPVVRNGRYFFQRRQRTQNQPVLYVREGVDGKDRALVNPNALSEGGTVALDWSFPSRDGRLLAQSLPSLGHKRHRNDGNRGARDTTSSDAHLFDGSRKPSRLSQPLHFNHQGRRAIPYDEVSAIIVSSTGVPARATALATAPPKASRNNPTQSPSSSRKKPAQSRL